MIENYVKQQGDAELLSNLVSEALVTRRRVRFL